MASMSTLVIDTHEVIARLEAAGFKPAQAEAVLDALKGVRLDAPSTKEFYDFRVEIKGGIDALRLDIQKLETRVEKSMSEFKVDILKWVATMIIAQAGLVVTLIKLL